VLLLIAGGAGALIDRVLGHGLWVFFSIAFVGAVLLNAVRIHLEDLAASIVLVPIAYALVGGGSTLIAGVGSGTGLKQRLASSAGVLVFSTPVLLLSVAVAAVLAIGRGRAVTMARRRARGRAIRRYGAVPPGSRPRARNRATGYGRSGT
jgi:hypothetical protein